MSEPLTEQDIKRFRIGDILFNDEQAKMFCELAMKGLRAEAGTTAEMESCIGELRQIADAGAMIHLLGWDDIQRTCEQAAKFIAITPSAIGRREALLEEAIRQMRVDLGPSYINAVIETATKNLALGHPSNCCCETCRPDL